MQETSGIPGKYGPILSSDSIDDTKTRPLLYRVQLNFREASGVRLCIQY
jgi:hypothetical protein